MAIKAKRTVDYGLADLLPDDLYNLLPQIVRATDPGGIRAYWRALEGNHNFLIGKLRDLPRLQDPIQAAKFSPSDFGESQAVYDEYEKLNRKRSTLTSGQLEYLDNELAPQIPQSIQARDLETIILPRLARTVGESLFGNFFNEAGREIIATAIRRHHIRGTHDSISILGAIQGYVDIKVTELWTRFALRDPDNIGSPLNAGDFAFAPEFYPYWPLNGRYDGVTTNTLDREDGVGGATSFSEQTFQLPIPDPGYTPFTVDDAGFRFAVEFPMVTPNRASRYHYNNVINGHNPFVNIKQEILKRLRPGTYTLSGGTSAKRASVAIPYFEDPEESIVFESITYGEHGNTISVSVSKNKNKTQQIDLEGPQSTIKFKSSHFDISYNADVWVFPQIFNLVRVGLNDDESYFDPPASRTPPDYPIVGSADGTPMISDPNIHWQMDREQFIDSMSSLRAMIEELRPITRTPRLEYFGFMIRDQMPYAPLCPIKEVILNSPDLTSYKLEFDENGQGVWVEQEIFVEDDTLIVQYDPTSGSRVVWKITNEGVWFPSITLDNSLDESVVYIEQTSFTGYAYVYDGELRFDRGAPAIISDRIHLDGSDDESVIGEEYALLVENPPSELWDFMSAAAISSDEPDCLIFQIVPEDDLSKLRTIQDYYNFHIAAHPGTFSEGGSSSSNWFYNNEGQMTGNDLRIRSAGLVSSLIEPVPTGDPVLKDGLRANYPVQFLNGFGKVAWRDRTTNEPFTGYYTAEALNKDTGATLVQTSVADKDGPIEGSGKFSEDSPKFISSQGFGVTPNDQYPAFPNVVEYRKEATKVTRATNVFTSVVDNSGNAEVTFDTEIFAGMRVRLEGATYTLTYRVISKISEFVGLLDVAFAGDDSGDVWQVHDEQMSGSEAQNLKITFSRESDVETIDWKLIEYDDAGSDSEIDSDANATVLSENSYPIAKFWFRMETKGLDTMRMLFSLDNQQTLQEYEGCLMLAGGVRDTLEITLIASNTQYFHHHDEDGPLDSKDLIAGNKWWRGGNWKGVGVASYQNRVGLPAILTKDDGVFPS